MTRRLYIDQPFELDTVLDGTQDFRWLPWKDDWHSGVLSGNLIHIRRVDGGVEYQADSDLDVLLHSYFRLEDDIRTVHADLSARDQRMANLTKKYSQLRVLRQPDPWGNARLPTYAPLPTTWTASERLWRASRLRSDSRWSSTERCAKRSQHPAWC